MVLTGATSRSDLITIILYYVNAAAAAAAAAHDRASKRLTSRRTESVPPRLRVDLPASFLVSYCNLTYDD